MSELRRRCIAAARYRAALYCFCRHQVSHTLQRTALPCNILQHTVTNCSISSSTLLVLKTSGLCVCGREKHSKTAEKHCSTLQHTVLHCNARQHTATRCSTRIVESSTNTLQYICNTLQHTATHCNTLQHTTIRTQWNRQLSGDHRS